MIALDDDLTLLAPGAAWHAPTRTLIASDLHAGYVATLQRRGHTLPSVDDRELHARLAELFARVEVARVVVAGDLVHGRPAYIAREGRPSPVDALIAALGGRELVVVLGNHDRGTDDLLARRGVAAREFFEVGPHLVLHGDEDVDRLRGERALAIARGGRVIVGHYHTALSLDDGAGARARVPAFAYAPGALCLPALTQLARGADLMRADHAEELLTWVSERELSLAVVVGARVIPVGTLSKVRAVKREAGRGAAAIRPRRRG